MSILDVVLFSELRTFVCLVEIFEHLVQFQSLNGRLMLLLGLLPVFDHLKLLFDIAGHERV